MDNLRCPEYLSESPSTSSTLNGPTAALLVSQNRRRSAKLTEQNRNRNYDVTRLVLGQVKFIAFFFSFFTQFLVVSNENRKKIAEIDGDYKLYHFLVLLLV